MPSITRTKTETLGTVSQSGNKVAVAVTATLTGEESRELRKLLKSEEVKATNHTGSIFGFSAPTTTRYHFGYTKGI